MSGRLLIEFEICSLHSLHMGGLLFNQKPFLSFKLQCIIIIEYQFDCTCTCMLDSTRLSDLILCVLCTCTHQQLCMITVLCYYRCPCLGRKMDLRVDRKSFRSTVYMVRERGRETGREERERERERRKIQTIALFLLQCKECPIEMKK